MKWSEFRKIIVDNLTDDLLDKKHLQMRRGNSNLHKTFGHCYVASEAAYYLLGGKEEGWKPCYIKHVGRPHWYLQHESGAVLDLTKEQFQTPVDYQEGRGTGFLTKEPSKRAKALLKRISESQAWRDVRAIYKNEEDAVADLTAYLEDLCSRRSGPYQTYEQLMARRNKDEAE